MEQSPPIFDIWRKEISTELSQAETSLAEALASLTAAEQSARVERIERVAFDNAFERRAARQALAGALAVRYRQQQDRMRSAEGALVRARNEVETLRRRVADLRDAVAQIDEIAPEAIEQEAA